MRLRRTAAVIIAAAVVMTPMVAPKPTLAAWTDHEYVKFNPTAANGACTTSGLYTTSSAGRFLTGTLNGASLDPIAGLTGITVVNNGTTESATSGSTALGSDAAKSAITASAINGAVNAAIGATLPITWSTAGTGVYTQWGQAHSTGQSAGASGAVTNAGAIDTSGVTAGTQPGIGTVDVSALLAQITGGTAALPGLSALKLNLGAVASTTSVDGCALAWGDPTSTALARSYLVQSGSLSLTDAGTAALLTSITNRTTTLQTAVTGLVGTSSSAATSLATTATNGLTAAVTSAIGSLGLLAPGVAPNGATVTISVDPTASTALNAALTEVRSDASGLVKLDSSTGTITIDLSVLGALNGRPANTPVLTSTTISSIVTALTQVLTAHVAAVESAWTTLTSSIKIAVHVAVTLSATIALVHLDIASVTVDYSGTAAQFAAGTETHPAPTVTALNGWVGLSGLVGALTNTLLGTSLYTPIDTAVVTLVNSVLSGVVTTVTGLLTTALSTAVTAISTDLTPLYSILGLTLNVQADASPYPTSYLGTPGTGVWTESALLVKLTVGTLKTALYFASSSVGRNHTLNTP